VESGVLDGRLLLDFAEAAVVEADNLTAKRDAVTAKLGEADMIDAAGIIAIFQAAVRIADATGIPLEDAKAEISAEFRKTLGLDAFTAD
jgi:alkylhydroperoxidase family enzyme